MSKVLPINKDESPKEVIEIFTEIEKAFGKLPNLFKAYSHYPPLLKANWEKVKAVLMQGSLSPKTKQAIAVLVSKDNSCNYCVAAHRQALRSLGVTDAELQQIENDIEHADFTKKELALINFARMANSSPLKTTDDDVANVLNAGATKSELIEALGVMEVFTSFNKFLDSLNIELDF